MLVGPGLPYSVPSAAATVAQAGDVIKISAGDYRGDVATWRANNLTICGIGGRARLFADGKSAQGKAIWVIAGANTVVEGVEFRNVTVADQNGAGIRAEGGDLTVRDCGFFDSDEGILGGSDGAVITIDRSEFARNGFGDGQSHNIYIGAAARLLVTASFFHEAKIGHNFKSRAKETRIENSYFMDGPAGTSSYLADFPNGGAVYLRGNLFHKGPNADNGTAIAFGQEGLKWSTNTLEMLHNTVVMTYSGGGFIVAPAGTQSVKLVGNLLAGAGGPRLIGGGVATSAVTLQSNVTTAASNFAGADNIAAPDFWPNSTVQAQAALPGALDPTYASDTPQPFVLRALSGGARTIGALQSAR
ncbi:MAG TPA: right-handed parallel beta-helix repeat-containing protein [Burkholderiaceae bacterium]|nr:right-handed parallel beta-helix repeat-containing protein [Burkholderiaceae bacterium]